MVDSGHTDAAPKAAFLGLLWKEQGDPERAAAAYQLTDKELAAVPVTKTASMANGTTPSRRKTTGRVIEFQALTVQCSYLF